MAAPSRRLLLLSLLAAALPRTSPSASPPPPPSPPQQWSAAPAGAATLLAPQSPVPSTPWTDVEGLSLPLTLAAPARVLVQFSLGAATSLGAAGANAGLGFLDARAQGLSGPKDYLGARVTLNGRATRLGGALATPADAAAGGALAVAAAGSTQTVALRSALVLTLQAGEHVLAVQWRSWGTGVVGWRSSGSAGDGGSANASASRAADALLGGRWLSALAAPAGALESAQPVSDARLVAAGEWADVPGAALNLSLPLSAAPLAGRGGGDVSGTGSGNGEEGGDEGGGDVALF